MTQDVQQSKKYSQYMKRVGWIVERVNGCQIFIRQFPLIGSFIKIQKPNYPIPLAKIEEVSRKYRAFKVVVEPGVIKKLSNEVIKEFEKYDYKESNSPYLPTKTIHINLTRSEKEILSQMKKKTRYSLRQAQKSRLIIKESKDVESFIHLKSNQFFPLGFFLKKDINALWQTFYPENAVLLRATPLSGGVEKLPIAKGSRLRSNNKFLASILLLLHRNTAHYWLAASTKQGKKLSAPTLLVWEAVKLSKKRGCKIFDFQGIYDPRFHKATKSWQGFTRFKKGFGGKEIEYPGCFVKYKLSF